MIRLIRWFWMLAGAGTSLLAYQYLLFNYLYYSDNETQHASAVVVFDGMQGRVQAGFQLLAEGRAPLGIISPATPSQLKRYIRTYGCPDGFRFLVESHARTTYENAFFTAEIIASSGMTSVILVTSRDHMPRAYLLLRCMLIGKGIEVYRMPVSLPRENGPGCKHRIEDQRLIYNEMAKTWGSVYEWAVHMLTGEFASRRARRSHLFRALEEWVLIR